MDYRKEAREILESLLEQIDDSYQKSIGYPTYDILAACAKELEEIYFLLDDAAKKIDVDYLAGEELTRFVYQRKGIIRKPATYAMAELLIIGDGIVPRGALFATEGGVEYESITESNNGKVLVACTIPGITGNRPAGAINKIVMSIDGVKAVSNQEPATGGYAAESDTELRERYLAALQEPATSGNIWHYKKWALDISGVSKAKVFPTWNGKNTVKVVIIDADHQPAGKELVERVQTYIDPGKTGRGEGVAPIGAVCTVTAAERIKLNIQVHLVDSGMGQVQEAIKKNIIAYLNVIAFEQPYVSYAKIANAVNDTDGVIDYSGLLVNGGVSNIVIPEGSVAILGGIQFV